MFGGASNIAERVDMAFLVILSISVVLLVVITFAMVYFVIRYSRRRNPKPSQVSGNLLLETIWTIVPTILALVMFYYGWHGFQLMRDVPKDTMLVKVTARMWSWLFEYDNGKSTDTLYVPLDRPVKLALSSQDVIHSLYVPAFRIKEDAVPGLETHLWFTPTVPGSFDLFCTEYCGLRHASMLSKVVVMPVDEFEAWYEREEPGVSEVTQEEKVGLQLIQAKGCIACHSTDGTHIVGPTFKGIFGNRTTVIVGEMEREIVVDEEYLRRSIIDPGAEVVKGYQPVMPPMAGMLTAEELEEIIRYLKGLE
ncbi:MAG: cytochrome c oxidase subunit II [Candidatus Glassbacteria bacterium]